MATTTINSISVNARHRSFISHLVGLNTQQALSIEAANAISLGNQPFLETTVQLMSEPHAKCVFFTHLAALLQILNSLFVPELPDITIYLEALNSRILGQTLSRIRIASPFLLRTAVPPVSQCEGRKVLELRRIGKRIAFGFENDLWLVLHLMIAGRMHWRVGFVKLAGKQNLAAFEFSNGTLLLTEAGTKKRASLHLVQREEALRAIGRGGLEVLDCTLESFSEALTSGNHTLKRALTDPHLFSGIGNAYSDEILHAARLSPVALTQKLSITEISRLHRATQESLKLWIALLRQQTGAEFPENVTAFRPEMAVHGKFGRPCPICGEKVQRIRYADNETNYCPECQTGGRLLADRALSVLLKKDWPKTPEELEELREKRFDNPRL
jgi:formamidopyrimidine-DNA glycosylase